MQMQCWILEEPDCDRDLFLTKGTITSLCHLQSLPWKRQMWETEEDVNSPSSPRIICLYFFNWVQISKFLLKNFRQLVWGGRRNLMRLLAQFQLLRHRPTCLGGPPLPGGEKVKMQLYPKWLKKKENAQQAKQWRYVNQYLQSTTG